MLSLITKKQQKKKEQEKEKEKKWDLFGATKNIEEVMIIESLMRRKGRGFELI